MNNNFRGPRTPTDSLRLESIKILAKLDLIIEFRPWLPTHSYRCEPAYRILFDCFSIGAPLGILLDLLGSPAPSNVNVDNFNFGLSFLERQNHVQDFIQRVHMLELQGRLPFGEVLRIEDLFNGTSLGFMKVLKTVNRILSALQDTYPGLFVIPKDAESRKLDAMDELLESEHIHVEFLRMIIDHAAFMSCESQALETALEAVVVIEQRLRQYHDRVLNSLQQARLSIADSTYPNWETVFAFDESSVKNNMASTYRSLCISYVSLFGYLEQIIGQLEPVLAAHAQMLLDILSHIPTRIHEYCDQLQNLLSLTLPDTPSSGTMCSQHDSLCNIILNMTDISTSIHEMSSELRTSRASKILKARAFHWHMPETSHRGGIIDPSELGMLVLDDILLVEDGTPNLPPTSYQIFLFESMLLCCLDGPQSSAPRHGHNEERVGPARYPIRPWELGPALRRTMPLNLIHAIPTDEMWKLRVLDIETFELHWDPDMAQDQASRSAKPTLSLLFKCPSGEEQHNQWCSALQRFVRLDTETWLNTPRLRNEDHSGFVVEEGNDDGDVRSLVMSEDGIDSDEFAPFKLDIESSDGRRHSHPRPWSLIARKGPHSESSSLHQQLLEEEEQEIEDVLSPNMLPTLFTPLSLTASSGKGSVPPLSPLALGGMVRDPGTFQQMVLPPTPPPEGDFLSEIASSERVMDFTGQIHPIGGSAVAGGGYSDVWKATLNSRRDGHGQELQVAIKVIRAHYGSPENEDTLQRRLARELDVWKQLKHPNILPLYGVTSGFGPYNSLVCPWMENGSVSRYMEKWGDLLSMTDRLQLLCEVAEGLHYLHSRGIVHGDLTGSNILIDDNLHACLCDFGLSNMISDYEGSSNHSTISGAIRWADATLFITQAAHSDESNEEQMIPTMTSKSDIYSFGSVTLEILTGRIPYHYIRTDAQVIFELAQGRKPRRPIASLVTDSQWEFISSRCWHDEPDFRPDIDEVVDTMQMLLRTSLEFRRYTSSEPEGFLLRTPDSSLEIIDLPRRHSEPLSSIRTEQLQLK
ncbi:TKL/TKL-ccin protein kinase [Lentinula raphanica]|nr:TKL/TKL-ccin protein kinase [Lentinula raphanica]